MGHTRSGRSCGNAYGCSSSGVFEKVVFSTLTDGQSANKNLADPPPPVPKAGGGGAEAMKGGQKEQPLMETCVEALMGALKLRGKPVPAARTGASA